MKCCQHVGIWLDHRDWHDAAIRTTRFAAIVVQHNMQNHIVVSRIAVVSMVSPRGRCQMDLDASRQQPAVTEVDQRLLEVRPEPVGPATPIDDRECPPVDRFAGARSDRRRSTSAKRQSPGFVQAPCGWRPTGCSMSSGRSNSPHSTRSSIWNRRRSFDSLFPEERPDCFRRPSSATQLRSRPARRCADCVAARFPDGGHTGGCHVLIV